MINDEWWMMNDEWWMMNDEWWMMNDEWWMMNAAVIIMEVYLEFISSKLWEWRIQPWKGHDNDCNNEDDSNNKIRIMIATIKGIMQMILIAMIRWMTVTMVFPLIYFHWNVHIFSLALTFNEGLAFFFGCQSVRLLQQVGWVGWHQVHMWALMAPTSATRNHGGWRMINGAARNSRSCVLLGAWQWLVHQRVSQVPSTIVAFDPNFACFFVCCAGWMFTPLNRYVGQLHTVDHVFSSWPGLEAKQANGLATHSCEHCCCSKVLDNILYVNLEWGNFGFSRSQSMATLDELDSEHKHRWRSIYACSTRAVTLMPMLRLVLLKRLRR